MHIIKKLPVDIRIAPLLMRSFGNSKNRDIVLHILRNKSDNVWGESSICFSVYKKRWETVASVKFYSD